MGTASPQQSSITPWPLRVRVRRVTRSMSTESVAKAARRPRFFYVIAALVCVWVGYMFGRSQPQHGHSQLDSDYLNSYQDWGMHVQMLSDKPRTEGYYQVRTTPRALGIG